MESQMTSQVVVHLNEEEIAELKKEINGIGGFQSLFRSLKTQIKDNEDIFILTPDIASRIVRYRKMYGQGGWQGRLRRLPNLLAAAERMQKAGEYLPYLLDVSEEDITDDGNILIENNVPDEMPYASPKRYSINNYGADYTVDGLVKRLDDQSIFVPPFQRGYVWTRKQASRYIESLLLGLPSPGIFLSRENDTRKMLVIDGQQRLRTLQYFIHGRFANDGDVFSLVGVDAEFEGVTYQSLDDPDRRQLNDSIIHATVVKQEAPPNDHSSIYYIFERINTGGTPLSPQEIRACIYRGSLNDLLRELNRKDIWRKLFDSTVPDARGRDQELMLRFFALYYSVENYTEPMTTFLNAFMKQYQHITPEQIASFTQIFNVTIILAADCLGENAFRPNKAIDAALLEATLVGLARRLQAGPVTDKAELSIRFDSLKRDNAFMEIASAPSDGQGDNVRKRVELAIQAFADVK